jgi:hypothetical protein
VRVHFTSVSMKEVWWSQNGVLRNVLTFCKF